MEDGALWNALQTAQLKTVVVELGAGLGNTKIRIFY